MHRTTRYRQPQAATRESTGNVRCFTRAVPDRRPPVVASDERGTLLTALDYLRECVVAKLDGVDEAAARRPLVPSGTSLLWLAVHLTAVEINLFQRILVGRSTDALVPAPPPTADTLALALARYAQACAESRRITDQLTDLGHQAVGYDRQGNHPTLRWLLTHGIEETARHLGHLDILREQIDGTTGR